MQRPKLADDPPVVGLDSSQMSSQAQQNSSGNAAASESGQFYELRVTNQCTYPAKPRTYDISRQAPCTLGELRHYLAERELYKEEMFEINLARKRILPKDQDDKPLAAFGIPLNKSTIIVIQRSEKYKSGDSNEINKLFSPSLQITQEQLDSAVAQAANRSSSESSAADDGSASHVGGSILGGYSSASATSSALVTYNQNSNSSGSSYGSASSYASSYNDWNKRPTGGFVGLSNQGATCYMNSLIQSLFMTPEFRLALYNWSFDEWATELGFPEHQRRKAASAAAPTPSAKDSPQDDGKESASAVDPFEEWKSRAEKASIPRQLQKLFAHLQLSDSRAVQTKNLTKSFGWTDAEAFTQHDVQELCRVLFDALERAWKSTKQENFINELYQGKMKDYVKCRVCGHESAREDKYLDIPLVIKGFGATTAVGSIEEAMRKFVEPEILDGSNQYFCEKCQAKVDADKGLKFTSFPYLLMLQLKRFDFDYETMRRIKLNDRVTFPQILDLNAFLQSNPAQPEQTPAAAEAEEAADKDKENSPEESADVTMADGEAPQEQPRSAVDPLFDCSKERIDAALKNGPAVYELYSILIHRGSAMGGHYYAYIKHLNDGKWYEFNDSSVTPIDESHIKDTFGSSDSGRGSYWMSSSGTNAYMLVYRQIDSARNVPIPSAEEIPQQIRSIIEEEEKQKQEKEKQKQREREMVKFRVLYKDEKRTIRIHKSEPLSKLVELATPKFGLTNAVENIRLRDWSRHHDNPTAVIEDWTKRADEQWMGTYNTGERTVVLETREPGSEWELIDTKKTLLRVFVYQNDRFPDEPRSIYTTKDTTLAEVRKQFEQEFGIPVEQQFITVESYGSGTVVGPEFDDKSLDDAAGSSLYWGMYVWVERDPTSSLNKLDVKTEEAQPKETPAGASESAVAEPAVEPSPKFVSAAPKHIKYLQSRVIIKFNHPDEPETALNYTVHASGSELVAAVRERIADAVKLGVDDFIIQKRVKVSYYGNTYKYEEVNQDDNKLSHLAYPSSKFEPTRVKVILKRGKPSRRGEISVPIFLMNPYPAWADDKAWESFKLNTPAFVSQLPSLATLAQIREELLKELKAKNLVPEDTSPERIRIRELSGGGAPSKVLHDPKETPLQYKYGVAKLYVQVLPEPEVKNAENQVLFIQRWYPDEFHAGDIEEMAFGNKMTLTEVAKQIGEKYGVANVKLHKAWMMSAARDGCVLETLEFSAEPSSTINSARMDDGDWFFWKDGDILPSEDKKEEKDKARKEEIKKYNMIHQSSYTSYSSSSYSSREKDLVIKQQDI